MQQRVDCAVRRVLWMCSCCVAGKRRTRFRRIGPPTKATSTVLFDCDVDIRVGSGFLNYINGYVSKSSDCVDFSAKEYSEADGDGAENTEWKRT